MDKETRTEAILRTMRLDSYAQSVAQHNAALNAFEKRMRQTHERVGGRLVRMSKQRKIAKYKADLLKIYSNDLDISRDAINNLKYMDRNA